MQNFGPRFRPQNDLEQCELTQLEDDRCGGENANPSTDRQTTLYIDRRLFYTGVRESIYHDDF